MAQASSIPLAAIQGVLKRLKNAGTISEISVEPAAKSGMTFLRIVFRFIPLFEHDLFRKNRYPLCANAAFRVRIML